MFRQTIGSNEQLLFIIASLNPETNLQQNYTKLHTKQSNWLTLRYNNWLVQQYALVRAGYTMVNEHWRLNNEHFLNEYFQQKSSIVQIERMLLQYIFHHIRIS